MSTGIDMEMLMPLLPEVGRRRICSPQLHTASPRNVTNCVWGVSMRSSPSPIWYQSRSAITQLLFTQGDSAFRIGLLSKNHLLSGDLRRKSLA